MDLNIQNFDKKTPLDMAIRYNKLGIVNFLQKYGARKSNENNALHTDVNSGEVIIDNCNAEGSVIGNTAKKPLPPLALLQELIKMFVNNVSALFQKPSDNNEHLNDDVTLAIKDRHSPCLFKPGSVLELKDVVSGNDSGCRY